MNLCYEVAWRRNATMAPARRRPCAEGSQQGDSDSPEGCLPRALALEGVIDSTAGRNLKCERAADVGGFLPVRSRAETR